jgi:hypothetical protein
VGLRFSRPYAYAKVDAGVRKVSQDADPGFARAQQVTQSEGAAGPWTVSSTVTSRCSIWVAKAKMSIRDRVQQPSAANFICETGSWLVI